MISRRHLLSLLAPALAGCGYRPLYGRTERGGVQVELAGIAVQEQNTRPAQLVRNELLSAMSPPGVSGKSRYRLNLAVHESAAFVSHLPSEPVDRLRYRLSATFELTPFDGGRAVTRGSSNVSVAYDTVRQPVADLQARDAAMERAAIELAQDIRLRLAASLSKAN